MRSKISVSQVAKQWLDEKINYVKQTSINTYRVIIYNHILGNFEWVDEFNEDKLQEFIMFKISEGLSQKTIKDIIVVIKMIIKFGYKKKYNEMPCLDLVFPIENKKKEIDVFTKQEQKHIMTHLEENFSFYNLGLMICFSTGLRIGEICGIKWSDICTDNGVLSVSRTVQRTYATQGPKRTEVIIDTPKTTKSTRDVPLSNKLLRIVRPLKRIINANNYLISNQSLPTEPRAIRKYFNELLQNINIRKMKFHSIRHTFATRCIESGADYKILSSILGHANIVTTLNLYVHPNNEEKKKVVEKMLLKLR